MTKQEFLAFSLPYGLKVLRPDNKTILQVCGIDNSSVHFYEQGAVTYGDKHKCKPILRPLSDLS